MPILDRINTEYMEASVVSSNNKENRINSFERNGFMANTVVPRFLLPNMSSTSNTNELSNLHSRYRICLLLPIRTNYRICILVTEYVFYFQYERIVESAFSLPNMSSTSNTNELSNLHVLENQVIPQAT